jgi:hypothetical protein
VWRVRVADQQGAPGLLGERDEGVGVFEGQGEGLLAEDVLAGAEGGLDPGAVQAVGQAHGHRVDFGVGDERLGRQAARARGLRLRPRRIGAPRHGGQLDLVSQGLDGAQVLVGEVTRTQDSQPNSAHQRCFLPRLPGSFRAGGAGSGVRSPGLHPIYGNGART